ncbi:PadR family transcriptional regulator [Actinoplanes sp. NPDC049802]|uniref:PadR family transcriptional regulator n=1 Tax=Actinoplanes sp. NPDC049802 TaxID=3154742 RepID=UPI0033D2EAD3
MRETTYFTLAALQHGPLHGYAIIRRVSELSSGRIRLATGTLYTALERLTTGGHIQVAAEEIVNGRARRSYELTPGGRAALEEQARVYAEAARVVTRPVVRPA